MGDVRLLCIFRKAVAPICVNRSCKTGRWQTIRAGVGEDSKRQLGSVIHIEVQEVHSHLDELVPGTVEETSNKLLDAEAGRFRGVERQESRQVRDSGGRGADRGVPGTCFGTPGVIGYPDFPSWGR